MPCSLSVVLLRARDGYAEYIWRHRSSIYMACYDSPDFYASLKEHAYLHGLAATQVRHCSCLACVASLLGSSILGGASSGRLLWLMARGSTFQCLLVAVVRVTWHFVRCLRSDGSPPMEFDDLNVWL